MSNKLTTLSKITQISGGYQFREAQPESTDGNIRYIQMRDVNSSGINTNSIAKVNFDEIEAQSIKEKYRLQIGDILFKNRGANNTASLFDLEWDNAIASHQFLIIRINVQEVLPAYIAWYINSKNCQLYFSQRAVGGTTSLVQKKTMEELEVVVPDVEVQEKIIRINQLQKKEKELLLRSIKLRERNIEVIMEDCLKIKGTNYVK